MSFQGRWWTGFVLGMLVVLGLVANVIIGLDTPYGVWAFSYSCIVFFIVFFSALHMHFGYGWEEWTDRDSPGNPYHVFYVEPQPLAGGFVSGALAVYVACLIRMSWFIFS